MVKSKKRLALFMHPGVGGAQKSMMRIASGFASNGYVVDVIHVRNEFTESFQSNKGVTHHDLEISSASTLASTLLAIPRLIKLLKYIEPDVLLVTGESAMTAALIAVSVSGCNVKVVPRFQVHVERNWQEWPWWRRHLVSISLRFLLERAYRLIAVSSGVADNVSRVFGIDRDRIFVAYNPTLTPEYQSMLQEAVNHDWFGSGVPRVILAVGRLTEQKGFDVLLRSFSKAQEKTEVRLMIIGDGPQRARLEKLVIELGIDKKVQFAGYQRNPYKYMNNADLFVLSSRWEGLPNVLIEAMGAGLKVIATDCPSGPRDILEDGKWGKLVPVADVEALTAALVEIVDSNYESPGTKERAKCFTMKKAIDEYESIMF